MYSVNTVYPVFTVERLNYFLMYVMYRRYHMTKKESGGGLMSSAGLMRYFEAEDSAIKIDPKTVVIAGAVMGAVVFILDYSYKMKLW